MAGITKLYFDPTKENLQAALAPSCTKIRKKIRSLKVKGTINRPLVEPSPKTPSTVMLDRLINETLEVICRAMSVPETPDVASLRVFIFKAKDNKLVCSHFWSQNPVKEHVGKTIFEINEESASEVAVVKAFVKEEITREEINPQDQKKLAEKVDVSDIMEYVIAATILNKDGKVWGAVDFDSLCETGKRLLVTNVSTSAIFKII